MKQAAKIFFVTLSLISIYASYSVYAQTPQELQLRQRIIDVLNSTAVEAKQWDDKASAARALAQIADLLWDLNIDNANGHLKAAWDAAKKIEEPKHDRSAFVNPSLRNAVRRDVLLVARIRAPKLAAIWLDEMVEDDKSADKTERGTFDDRSARSSVLLQMANEVVATDPQTAAALLIESLRDGISFNFQTTLIRIQEKNTTLSEAVFSAALKRLSVMGMKDPNELLILYSYLYTPGRVQGANTSDSRNRVQLAVGGPRVSVAAAIQNPALALEFLNLASDLLLSTPLPMAEHSPAGARALVSVIGTFLSIVTEQLPEKAALLRARAQQLDTEAKFSSVPTPRRSDTPDVRPGESNESFIERRVDLLEETAAKGRDVLTRDIGYATAALATTVERYERGLLLAGKVDDKNLREGVRSWILYRAVLNLIAKGDFDEAQRLNLRNDDAIAKAIACVVGAQKLVENKDAVRANEWLREAGAIVRRSEASDSLARVAFGIVSTYARFDVQSAFEWLVYAVKLSRTSTLSSLSEDRAPALKRISGITPIFDPGSETQGFSLQAAVGGFPPDQFEQVLAIVNEISSREARGIAVLALSARILKSKTRNVV